MFKQVALIVILIITLNITPTAQPAKNPASDSKATGKPEVLLASPEAAKAIARLGDLSPAVIRERLRLLRSTVKRPNPLVINQLIEEQKQLIVSGHGVEQLKAALQPVLDYHGYSQMPILVHWSEKPMAYMIGRAIIIITTRLMISASVEELRGIIAHELAHEYIWDERSQASKTNDGKLMRECELFCDAVATFTLKELGDDPSSYARVLDRLTIGRAESDSHPSLNSRLKLIKFLCQRIN